MIDRVGRVYRLPDPYGLCLVIALDPRDLFAERTWQALMLETGEVLTWRDDTLGMLEYDGDRVA